jgi:hypothetical protein
MAGYRRTISFPAPKPGSGGTDLARASDKLAAYRIRSVSLPCRFHPLVLQLDDDVAALRLVTGQSQPSAVAPSASSVSAAASQVGRVLASLSELLSHPQARDPLRRLARSPLAEGLLDDLLRLADSYGSFRQALVALAAGTRPGWRPRRASGAATGRPPAPRRRRARRDRVHAVLCHLPVKAHLLLVRRATNQ